MSVCGGVYGKLVRYFKPQVPPNEQQDQWIQIFISLFSFYGRNCFPPIETESRDGKLNSLIFMLI